MNKDRQYTAKDGIDDDLLLQAIAAWGAETQSEMMIEECLELATVLQHQKKGKASRAEIIDEIADVKILIRQMELIYLEADISERVAYKMNRLSVRLVSYLRNR
jgi:NTP pyrophosphatase (non-canonical NTP hydrolase)